jgi:class 3 adenylate cyclase/pimeloyl-ACP methyl ester carboxylesterase
VDVAAWLREQGFGRYEPAFRDHEIDWALLPELTEGDLEKLGLPLGPRKKLLKAIAAIGPDETERPRDSRGAAPREAERRQLTVMFVDLVGSTALTGRLDPEDMGEVIRTYQNTVAGEIARFEGHVAKFMGDGVLVYFGWPSAHEDDAERAVRAALAVTDAVATLIAPTGDALAARVGVDTGLVVVGDAIGDGATREDVLVGGTPNLAARLQALARPGTVVISPATRHLVNGLFELQDLGPHGLKGFTEPVRLWHVLGQRPIESRFEARHVARLSPIIGRENELALLRDRWARAVEGEGQIVLLSGEAGIGKSRLARSLTEVLAGEPYTRLRYQCSPFHSNSAFHPTIERLERAAAFDKDDSPEAKLDKLEALLAPSTRRMAETAPLFAALLSIPTGDRYPALNLDPQQQKRRTLEVLVEQVEALSSRQPVLMVCEDAHWIDPSTQDVFTLLAERIGRLAVLMLVTFRPGFAPPWSSHAHATQLSVGRLTQRQGTEIINRLAGGRHVSASLVDQILLRAEGVPLFIEELTKTVLDAGLPAWTDGHDELSGPLPPLAIPATLQDSLTARLDRLAPVKDVAQVAAVVGREFSVEVLAAAAGRPAVEVSEALDQLVAAELIFRRRMAPEATYTFKHALVQETAYRSLLRGRRQLLHRNIAEFLEHRSPQTAELQPELLAHHFQEAGLAEPAAAYWLRAARRAKERYANKEAAAHLRKCLDVAAAAENRPTRLSTTSVEALLLLGDLAGLTEDLEQANACYHQALDLAGDEPTRVLIQNKLHCPKTALRDGARIMFYEHGSGEHTLLFVNPIVYGLAVFQPILEQLCQEFRIITIDCRGTGSSDPLTRPFPLSEHAEDVAAVIESAGCRSVTGVGISRGSNLLVKLAVARPDMIGNLVLVGCPLAPPGSGHLRTFSADYARRRAAAYQRQDVEELVKLQNEFVYSEPGTEELKRSVLEHRLKLPPDTILSFYDPDPEADVSGLLRDLGRPTLIMHGTDDRLILFDTAKYMAEQIPGATLYAFEGKGHLPIFTATTEFCGVLRRFVRGNGAPVRGRTG